MRAPVPKSSARRSAEVVNGTRTDERGVVRIRRAAFGTRQVHDETTVGELAAEFAHFIGERKVFVVAADMEERHRTVFGRTGALHGDHRRDADAGAD